MSSRVRIVGSTICLSVVVGLIASGVVILADESPETVRHSLGTWRGGLDLLTLCTFVSCPLSIPAGALGGILAAWAFERRGHILSPSAWLRGGVLAGVGIGTLAIVAPTAIMSVAAGGGPPELFLAMIFLVAVGAITGGVAGGLVGWLCAHALPTEARRRAGA